MSKTYVYAYDRTPDLTDFELRGLLGGKGAGLAEMTKLEIPVPPGFTLTTEVCNAYYANQRQYPAELDAQVRAAVAVVEQTIGRKFGDSDNPLLFSVRSGARASMPGMMDTILNLGLNDKSVEGLAKVTGNARFAWDSYRRFVAMYGDVVLGLKPKDKKQEDPFEAILEDVKHKAGAKFDTDLTADDLKGMVQRFKATIKDHLGMEFPEDPWQQLWGAIGAVFQSWMNDRAIHYRHMNGIPSEWGTAVNIQTMVFGNRGETSGTGVGFTRDPALGEDRIYGEFLMNAQGEDVVAGTRTPRPLPELEALLPAAYTQLIDTCKRLERHFTDMQDFEFTIEDKKLWMLQTRTAKRHPFAAARIAVDMQEEGLIDEKTAVLRPEADGIAAFLAPIFDQDAKKKAATEGKVIAKGLPAGPGGASGRVVFHASDAEEWRNRGEKVLLVRKFTSPEDIRGMDAAQGILTAQGGMTSHAALVARQMGKVCIVGCGSLSIDYDLGTLEVGGHVVKEGDWLSIDGFTAEVILGQLPTKPSEVQQVIDGQFPAEKSHSYHQFAKLMAWADKYRQLEVWTNADTPKQAATAVRFGAQGIGLCRTEHMFFEGERIMHVRRMILATNESDRADALASLFPMQKGDFYGIFKAMEGKPVTVRLLDPPLHEFLPSREALKPEVFAEKVAEVAHELGVSSHEVESRIEGLHESNPMLGHRGCRLGITFPAIYAMQIRAIVEAACDMVKEGLAVRPEIMIPLVGTEREMVLTGTQARTIADEVIAQAGVKLHYMVGTMIELPRACVTADAIAKTAEFFSFGTNDLTQTTCGISRDDTKGFMSAYVEQEVFAADPFQRIDQSGVGELMKIAIAKGRTTRPGLQIGICGEHGGEPTSVKFCHDIGLNYVSCSPFRVPVARLAAAQAAIRNPR